ncbi:hypothetical protein [Actinomadura sp.]|uniref:hypothetical protein n=1 Tax=Actinomadura sp. TaxID=1989 RepID=UPI0037C9A6C8
MPVRAGTALRPRVALPAGVFVLGAALQVALSARPEQGDPAPVLAATRTRWRPASRTTARTSPSSTCGCPRR